VRARSRLAFCALVVFVSAGPQTAYSQASAASVLITPQAVDFGVQAVGTPSSPAIVTVKNMTSSIVQIQTISSGIDFSATNNCVEELAPGADCAIKVVFQPAITGERRGTLQVSSSGNSGAQFVALSGSGE
jgi:transmembrane protein TMEM131